MEENLTEKIDGISIGRRIARAYEAIIFDSNVREYYQTDTGKIAEVYGSTTTFGLECHRGTINLIEKSEFAEDLLNFLHKTKCNSNLKAAEIYGPDGLEYRISVETLYKKVPVTLITSNGEKKTVREELDGFNYNLFIKRKEEKNFTKLMTLKDRGINFEYPPWFNKETIDSLNRVLEEVLDK